MLAFRDVNPQAPVHVLVIPRVHVASLNEVTSPALMAEVLQMARAVAKQEGIAAGGYRVVFNTERGRRADGVASARARAGRAAHGVAAGIMREGTRGRG